MYIIKSESKNPDYNKTFEISNLEDLFNESPIHEEYLIDFPLSKLYKDMDFNLFVFKPIKDDDFIILYSNKRLYNYIDTDISCYTAGRSLKELFYEKDYLNHYKRYYDFFYNGEDNDVLFKLYDGDDLLFAGHEVCIRQDDYLFVYVKNETEDYLTYKIDTKVFEDSTFPIIFIDSKFEITKANQRFLNEFDFNLNELNDYGISNLIESFTSQKCDIKNFNNALRLIFKKSMPVIDGEIQIRVKNNSEKWFNVHMKLVNNDLIQVAFDEITDLKTTEKIAHYFRKFFYELEGLETEVAFLSFFDGYFHLTNEIFSFLEIPENPDLLISRKNILWDYIIPEDQKYIKSIIPDMYNNNFKSILIFRVRTAKNNIHYLKTTIGHFKEDNKNIYSGFIQNVTSEYTKSEKIDNLEKNLNKITSTSNVGIVTYKNKKFYYTPEIFNILDIQSNNYISDTDLFRPLIINEDINSFVNLINSLTPSHPREHKKSTILTKQNNTKIIDNVIEGNFSHDGNLIDYVCYVRDITKEELNQREAIELQEKLTIIKESNNFVIAEYKNGKYSFNKELYNILEIEPGEYDDKDNLIEYFSIPNSDYDEPKTLDELTVDNNNFKNIWTIKTPNNNVKFLESYVESKFDENGKLCSYVSFTQEITDKVKRENELKQLSEERKLLLQEVHHRIKNNLQLISSFLHLDSRYYKNNPEYVINKSENRIETMALAHEQVYQSDNLSHINLKILLKSTISYLFHKYKSFNIKTHLDIDDVYFNMDNAIPFILLSNELVFNTIRHAFPDNQEGNLFINLRSLDENFVLKIWDDGVGLPDGFDIFSSPSLGFLIIRRLTSQLEGKLEVLDNVDGFGVKLSIPK